MRKEIIGYNYFKILLGGLLIAVSHRDEDGVLVLAAEPLLGREGGHVAGRVGIEVLLEELRLPRHGHRDHLAQARVVEPEEARDLARRHVHSALRHHADASLRVRRLERVDVVHERRLGRDLEVADHRVTLLRNQ